MAEKKLKDWNATVRDMHNSYDKLLFFSVSKVLSLHKILSSPAFSADEMVQEVGFLFENDPEAIKKLKTAIEVITLVTIYVAMYIFLRYLYIVYILMHYSHLGCYLVRFSSM